MAAIVESDSKQFNGDLRIRSKRLSTRVDMTPMVDLGFLLITFFMLATTMSKPTSMTVAVPVDDIEKEPIRASGVLTLFLGAHDKVYYLDGVAADDSKAPASLKAIGYGTDLRNVIFASQRRVSAAADNEKDKSLIVIIKPTAASSYKNMVDALDEMAITRSRRYVLLDKLTESEQRILGDEISVQK